MGQLPTTTSIAMKRQKNLIQTKITETTPEKEPGEIVLTTLPEKEFKIKVIATLMELQRNMQDVTDKVGRENTKNKTISGRT